MSTREGNVILLDDVLNEAVERAFDKFAEKSNESMNEDDRRQVAEAVGVGSIIFNDLKNDRVKDILFSWDDAISLEGDTGPYIMYAHARMASILRKGEWNSAMTTNAQQLANALNHETAINLLKHIVTFPDVLNRAEENCKPSMIARYMLDLAHNISSFYAQVKVLVPEEETKNARLALVALCKDILAMCLTLLGMKPLDKM